MASGKRIGLIGAAVIVFAYAALPAVFWGDPEVTLDFPDYINDPSNIPVRVEISSYSDYYQFSDIRFWFDPENSTALGEMTSLLPLGVPDATKPMPDLPMFFNFAITWPRTRVFEFEIDLKTHDSQYHDNPAFASGKDAEWKPVDLRDGSLTGHMDFKAEWAKPLGQTGWQTRGYKIRRIEIRSEVIGGVGN